MPDKEGNTSVIQLKDVSGEGVLNFQDFQRVLLKKFPPDDCIKLGDILFKAKTNHPVAAVVGKALNDTIATAHYFIVRLNVSDVLPGYLAWYLNQRPAQIYFSKNAGGTRIQVITKQVLGNLEVVIPELSIQKKVEEVYRLYLREGEIMGTLKEKNQKLVSAQLMRVILK